MNYLLCFLSLLDKYQYEDDSEAEYEICFKKLKKFLVKNNYFVFSKAFFSTKTLKTIRLKKMGKRSDFFDNIPHQKKSSHSKNFL